MKEHPIPQDITGYRFHIVGSMTLKQFGEVLVGVILSFIVYQTNLFFFIKWPLIILFFGGGLIAAFIPIEERPISHWLTTFVKILYKPTQFFWKRKYNIPEPFLFKGNEEDLIQVQEIDLTPARRQRIKEFLNSTSATDPKPEDLTSQEQSQIANVLTLFEQNPVQGKIQPTQFQKPDLKVRVRTLRVDMPDPNQQVVPVQEQQAPVEIQQTITDQQIEAVLPTPDISTNTTFDDSQKNVYLDTQQVAQNIEIPEEEMVKVESPFSEEKQERSSIATTQQEPDTRSYISSAQTTKQEPTVATTTATFNQDLPFPQKPTVPNKLVGMVLSNNTELIPEAIVEISTENGDVVRAVKTNALGQFFITTPLKPGKYVISAQKNGYTFEPMGIELKNKIVDPVEIRSV